MKVKTVKAMFASVVAAAGLMAFAEGDLSITLNRVQQRYPWNGMVDIDYTVAGVPEPANYFVRFTATTAAGVKYVAHEMLDASTLINASNGTYRVTWVATAEGTVFQDCAEFFTKNAKYKAELVYSSSDKSQIPYPYYTVIDVSDGPDATNYPVAYEYFANTHLATNKYNTAEYKTNKIVLRKIHACTFTMGSPEDEVGRENVSSPNNNKETQHVVTLTEDYYVGMFPITQMQWLKVVGGGNPATSGGDDADICPVEGVSYRDIRGSTKGINLSLLPNGSVDADSFLGKLRDKSGLTDLDLPSEAQWENAARAGTTSSTYFGNNVTNNMSSAEIGKYVWHLGNSDNKTHGVGQVIPNQWGLYDTLGNVLEICLDRVAAPPTDDWGADQVTDPLRAVSGRVVVRGGYFSGDAIRARSAARDSMPSASGSNYFRGFRLARRSPGAVLDE